MKHFFDQGYSILQFGVKNTLEDQVLSKVNLKIKSFESQGMKVEGLVGLADGEQIKNGDLKFLYVILKNSGEGTCKISQKLSFTITEIDVDTEEEVGSYEEEYEVPDVNVAVRDYVRAEICP